MIADIVGSLSERRFHTCASAAGHNAERALQLYVWNAKLGASFHLPIQAVEVALRNRVNLALKARYGPEWWSDPAFLQVIDRERQRDIDTVRARIERKRLKMETDQIVASLSFGFWVGMLNRRYNPHIWSRHLRHAFPDLPADVDHQRLFAVARDIAGLRNRISHHEPLLRLNVTQEFGNTMRLLGWLCVATANWIRPHCEVMQIVRRKP